MTDAALLAGTSPARRLHVVEREPASGPALIGRAAEIAELLAALERAGHGRGGLQLLTGEAGIGKTRLADALCSAAETSGALVCWGRCWEGDGAPPYWPWVQVIRATVRALDPEDLRDAVTGHGPQLAMLDTELGARLGAIAEGECLAGDQARFALFDAVAGFLGRVADQRPLVVILDDLHSADEASLLLLRFVVRQLRDRRLLSVATYRESGPHRGLLAELGRDGDVVALRGLAPEDTARLLESAGGAAPDAAVTHLIQDTTDGNPFFVEQMARSLAARRRLGEPPRPGERLVLPRSVREAVSGRIEHLAPGARDVLSVAAVIGREFDVPLLAACTGRAPDDLLVTLDAAVDEGLVAPCTAAAGRYAFAHALLAQTLYEVLGADRRVGLHRDVARALEAVDTAEHVAEIAHHWFAAAAGGDAAPAVDACAAAGRAAAEALAYDAAAAHYEKALEAMTLGALRDDERRGGLLLALGDVRWRAGDGAGARGAYRRAAEIGRGLVHPRVLAAAAIGFAGGGGFRQVVRADPETIGLLEEARIRLAGRVCPLCVRVRSRLALELSYAGRPDHQAEVGNEALETARTLGEPRSLLVAMFSRHWSAQGPDQLAEREANAQEWLEVARGAGDAEMTYLAHHALLDCRVARCDMPGAYREVAAMIGLDRQLRQPYYAWRTTCSRAARAAHAGRLQKAEQLVAEATRAEGLDDPELVAVGAAGELFLLRWMQGRLDEVADDVRSFCTRYPWIQPWRLPLLYAELGRGEEAGAELDRQLSHDGRDFPRDGLWIARVAALAHACAYLGDERRAAVLYDLLAPYADRNVATAADESYGPVAIRLGMLATTLRRFDVAEAHFAAAGDICRRAQVPVFTALCLAEHARMLLDRRGAGDLDAAVERLAGAERLCSTYGLGGVGAHVARLSDRAAAAPAAGHGVGYAFTREGEYWTISWGDEWFRLRDGKGLRYLQVLVSAPGTDLHVLDIVAAANGGADAITAGQAAVEGLHRADGGGAGAALDDQAKAAYRARLGELESELDEARTFRDTERVASLQAEQAALAGEIAAAVGLGGRDRPQVSEAERARVNVTRSIRATIDRIAEHSAPLGEHLRAGVRTGTTCSYTPVPLD